MVENKVALITGASRGLGFATAQAFARDGAKVVITGLDEGRLEAAQAALAEAGADVLAVRADVSKEEAVQETFERAFERFGRVDCLVNNAGKALLRPLAETPLSEWEEVLAVNATGPFLMCREAVRRMTAAGIGGSVVNVASVSGETGAALAAAYCAAKAALIGLTRAVAKEVAAKGIRVNCVSPGAMDTDMFQKDTVDAMAAMFGRPREDLVRATLSAVPMRRLLEPAEVADLVLFLASDRARGITGRTYTVAGGYDIH